MRLKRMDFKKSFNLLSITLIALIGLLGSCSNKSNPSIPYSSNVLLVGTFKGVRGDYPSIQDAINHAKPGDWILIAPGDYHEQADYQRPVNSSQLDLGGTGGVLITTPNLHIIGMDRNSVVIDGTKPGARECSNDSKDQEFGPKGKNGRRIGRNGIVVFKANNVSIENLTVCNFLAYSGQGNEIWFNGGDGSAKIGMQGYKGAYLTASSTYYGPVNEDATYGIFSSNAAGPASWDNVYASNFNDSGMYVGACQQTCNITIDNAWMEYNALGYSGTNSGGQIIIEHSQFDNNQDGFDTNTQIQGDPPPPQDGRCPNNEVSPITHTHDCWVFMDNYVHDNNNPNVPQAPGYASAGPTGTGMTVSGGRYDTIMNNIFENNGAWGILFVPFPDSDKPYPGITCAGSGGTEISGFGCVYDPIGNALIDNKFIHNGFFGNPSNSDYGQIVLTPGKPENCFRGNTAPDSSAPPNLEQTQPVCGPLMTQPNFGGDLLSQVLCDTHFGKCPAGAYYPQVAKVVMHPIPKNLPSMPNPCVGVPDNPWCKNGHSI